MGRKRASADDFLRIGRKVRVLPIIHGSGDFAVKTRDELLDRPFDCLAVPLPPSFQEDVEHAVLRLPKISIVLQRDLPGDEDADADADLGDEDDEERDQPQFSYVPIDPCQGVIAALRLAIGEHVPREFIDKETPRFEPIHGVYPDPYALKKVSPAEFGAAILAAIPPPASEFQRQRALWMAKRLRELESRYESIVFVCSLLDWPWIKDAYDRDLEPEPAEPFYAPMQTCRVNPKTLIFMLGELPFLTGLYERGRIELADDGNISVDGLKELVLEARDRLRRKLPKIADRITPQVLAIFFRYARNLALVERRLTPWFFDVVLAAKQIGGDDFARAVAETSREYHYDRERDRQETEEADDPGLGLGAEWPMMRISIDRGDAPLWGIGRMASRLPGQSFGWRTLELRPAPKERDKRLWQQRWNPYGMCSWPPEDDRIESFQQHVRDQAKAIIGADLARSEKFTTSLRDGLDIRETLRNWHAGDLYVKVIPPSRGTIDVVVFLFDTPADPELYVHRSTWYAEHDQESTLAFFATDPMQNLVGPGIAQSEYGGAFFLFPPRLIPDIWTDRRLNFADDLETRLLAGAFVHSQERHVAVVSPRPPLASWRRLAKRFGRKIVHLPLKRFSAATIERLRKFHVLNGHEIRSYAAEFIRDS